MSILVDGSWTKQVCSRRRMLQCICTNSVKNSSNWSELVKTWMPSRKLASIILKIQQYNFINRQLKNENFTKFYTWKKKYKNRLNITEVYVPPAGYYCVYNWKYWYKTIYVLTRYPQPIQFHSFWAWKKNKLKMLKKCKKFNCRLWKKAHAHFQTIINTPLRF